MPPILKDLELLARQAGDILRAGFGQEHQIGYKGPVDLVTEVDHRSDSFLIQSIRARFPEDLIVTEESGRLAGESGGRWYIDPLDGTVNFAHGVPIFCVSIGYADPQGLQLGAVYDPSRDECFTGERGRGAWLNGAPLRVSHAPDLLHSLLVTGFPYDRWNSPDNNLEHFARLTQASQGVRRLGSAALDLCYTAAGRFDGYWEIGLNPWDVAAGAIIAAEAGAVITDFDGQPDFMKTPYAIVVANPQLHPQFLAALQESE